MPPTVRATIERLMEDVWNEGEYDDLKEIVSPNLTMRDLSSGQNVAGADGLKDWLSSFRKAFPDLEVSSQETITEGEAVAHHWVLRGTHQGPFMGTKGSGNSITLHGMTMMHFRNNRIDNMVTTYDRLGLLEQAGGAAAQAGR
jgi:steroid delta-isomerase-like uncharacterized protein